MFRSLFLYLLVITIFSAPLFAAQDYLVKEPTKNDPSDPAITTYEIDLDSDKNTELIKVIYGEGVSDKPLTVEVYKGNRLIALLNGDLGIQSNYKIEDTDGDGKKEIII